MDQDTNEGALYVAKTSMSHELVARKQVLNFHAMENEQVQNVTLKQQGTAAVSTHLCNASVCSAVTFLVQSYDDHSMNHNDVVPFTSAFMRRLTIQF